MMHWSPLPAVRGGTFEIRRSDAVGPSHESTSMPVYRSRTTTHGRNMAGARGLWRATGMTDADFGKPNVAIANPFTQFVPGPVHMKELGEPVAREVEQAGGGTKK